MCSKEFHGRHQRPRDFLLARFEKVREHLITDAPLSENRRLLIGAYFTQEYAVESAALFNPSIVWHPDQSGLPVGSRRFVLSLRATGEGHLSSITFRSGVIDARCAITVDEPTRYATPPNVVPDSWYKKSLFVRKLNELGLAGTFTNNVMGRLEEEFSIEQFDAALQLAVRENRSHYHEFSAVLDGIVTLAKSNLRDRVPPQHGAFRATHLPLRPNRDRGDRGRPLCLLFSKRTAAFGTTPPTAPTTERSSCRSCWKPRTSFASGCTR